MLTAPSRAAPPALADRESAARRADRRHQTARHRHEHGDDECEQHGRRVDAHLGESRDAGGSSAHEGSDRSRREQESDQGRDRRDNRGLGHEVQRDPSAPGAERVTDGEFTLTGVGPHERQVRDVGAGDKQQQRRGAGNRPERPGDSARDVRPQRHQHGRWPRLIHDLPRRHTGDEQRHDIWRPREHRREIALRVGDRHARLQANDGVVGKCRGRRIDGVELERHPQLGRGGRHLKARRQDTRDLTTDTVHIEPAADDAGIGAETHAPHRLTDEHDGRCAGAIFGVGERVAEDRRQLEHRNESRRDRCRDDTLRLDAAARVGDVHFAFAVDADTLDGPREPEIREVGRRRLRLVDQPD